MAMQFKDSTSPEAVFKLTKNAAFKAVAKTLKQNKTVTVFESSSGEPKTIRTRSELAKVLKRQNAVGQIKFKKFAIPKKIK